MRTARNALIALAALFVIGLVAAGPASAKDRNHDKIPDRWEKRHHLSLKVNQARRDQDHDQLRNRAEFRTGSDPRDADSDDDGIEDGDENAGTISAFDGTSLTINLANGSSITGAVDENTEVKCDDEVGHDGEDDSGPGENSGPSENAGSRHDGRSEDDSDDEDEVESEDDSSEDDSESESGNCSVDDLAVGAAVHEAEIRVGSGGAIFTEIELAK